jgi:serine/threonine protein kinase
MSQPSSDEFLAILRKSQLLSDEQLGRVSHQLQSAAAGVGAEQIASELVRQQVLTEWQKSQLLRGQTGFILQEYRLLKPVGKGGMGHVFRASDRRNGAIVAIKVMSRRLTGDKKLVNRFRREIRASSLLNSPHIVRTLDAGRVGDVDFMVMEYVNGDQLDRVIRRLGVLPVSVGCEIVRQAAVGLQHAFEKQMVHRDIKPANLIIDWSTEGTGTIKLMDLGLVRLESEDEEKTSVTRAGQVMGTPDYMSPEQGWDTASVDIRADIYSLGCTLFRLIGGRIPFVGDNPLQVLMARCYKDAPSVRGIRPEIPEAVDAIVRRMTLRDPDCRYQTPQEVVDALTPFCSPFTLQALRQAAAENSPASQDDVELLMIESDNPENMSSPDVGYQQFIREMGSGATVDMMNIGTAAVSSTSETLVDPAVLPVFQVPVPARENKSQRPKKRRGQKVAWMAAGGASATLAAAVLILRPQILNPFGTHAESSNMSAAASLALTGNKSTGADAAASVVVATIVPPPQIDASAGTEARHLPTVNIVKPATEGTLSFELDQKVPVDCRIDAETGTINWNIPALQTPAVYEIPFRLIHRIGSTQTTIAAAAVTVNVTPAKPVCSLPDLTPIDTTPERPIDISIGATGVIPAGIAPEYRITAGKRPGMRIRPDTGQFHWVPSLKDAGSHEVNVELNDKTTGRKLASATVRIVVQSTPVTLTWPEIPIQSATAGQLFEMVVPSPTSLPDPGGLVRCRIDNQAAPGAVFETGSRTLKWMIPESISGRVEIPLIAEPATAELEFTPDSKPRAVIVISVQPSRPVSRSPSSDQIAAAESKLRESMRRELAQARTTSARSEMAHRLFEQSLNQTPDAADYALLKIVDELAEKSRSWDLLFETGLLRARRFGIDELPTAMKTASEIRRSSVTPLQSDLIVEHCLRLALSAATAEQWSKVVTLLSPAEQLLRGLPGISRTVLADISEAKTMAEDLARVSLENAAPADSDRSRVDSLKNLLKRWQFLPMFQDSDMVRNGATLTYIQSPNLERPLPENGRSLWKLADDRIAFEASSQKGFAGLINASGEEGRFIVRFQLLPGTSSAGFAFAAAGGTDRNGFLMTLDSTAAGKIQRLPGLTPVAEPSGPSSVLPSSAGHVEILVDGTTVAAKMNGTVIISTELKDLTPGRFGLIVPLLRPETGPKLDLRRPRILVLPDETKDEGR